MQGFVGSEGLRGGRGRGGVVAYSFAEDGVARRNGAAVGVYPQFEGAGVELGVDCLGWGADFDFD